MIQRIALMILLRPLISAFAKLVTGAATAGIVYYFLMNTVQPFMDRIDSAIYAKVSEISTIGGTSYQVIQYLDFPHCISLLLTASAACLSIKIMSVAVRAFGINTG